MNDRFKFRVWSDKQKKKYYWSDIIKMTNSLYALFVDNRALGEGLWYIQQSTGLKDKNGKLIYEGDILKAIFTTPHGKIIEKVCKVEFSRCAFWVRDGIRAFYLDNENCVYEVIGSIYENADLLKECE